MPHCAYEPSGLEVPAVAHHVQLVATAVVGTATTAQRRTPPAMATRSGMAAGGLLSRFTPNVLSGRTMSTASTAPHRRFTATMVARRPLPMAPPFLQRTRQDAAAATAGSRFARPQPTPDFASSREERLLDKPFAGSSFSVAVQACDDAPSLLELVKPYLTMPEPTKAPRQLPPQGILYGSDLANALTRGVQVGLAAPHLFSLVDVSMATMRRHYRYHAFPQPFYFEILLKALISGGAYSLAATAFERMLHYRVTPSPRIFNALVERATRVPDALAVHDTFSLAPYLDALAQSPAPVRDDEGDEQREDHALWSAVLAAGARHERPLVARPFALLAEMEKRSAPAGWQAVHRVMRLCKAAGEHAWGVRLFDAWSTLDRPHTPGLYELAIRMGAHVPDKGMAYAVRLMDDLRARGLSNDTYISNALLYCLKETGGSVAEARSLLGAMRAGGVQPDTVTYVLYFILCAARQDKASARRELPAALRLKEGSPSLFSAVLASCDTLEEVLETVRALQPLRSEPSVFAYAAMMQACSRAGAHQMRDGIMARALEAYGTDNLLARIILNRTMLYVCAHARDVEAGVRAFESYREAIELSRKEPQLVTESLKRLSLNNSIPRKLQEFVGTEALPYDRKVISDLLLLTSTGLSVPWPTFEYYSETWCEFGQTEPDTKWLRSLFVSLKQMALAQAEVPELSVDDDEWRSAAQSLFAARGVAAGASAYEIVDAVNARMPGGAILSAAQLREYHPLSSLAILVLAEGLLFHPRHTGAFITAARDVCYSLQDDRAAAYVMRYCQETTEDGRLYAHA